MSYQIPNSSDNYVSSGIPVEPYTFIAMESTANGVGNFFHERWLRAKSGESNDIAVFVPWYEIDMCRKECDDVEGFAGGMDAYERALWRRGLTLEMIAWYREKRKDIGYEAMFAEYPTDDVEAFVHTGGSVFASESIEALRAGCRPPAAVGEVSGLAATGAAALRGVRFTADPAGLLKVWRFPCESVPSRLHRYVVSVDVGGRSRGSDYSVIAVFDRFPGGGDDRPEVVAQWRGHCDHDILGWRAAAIARWYHNALLIVESNSLEASASGHSQYILEELNGVYRNMYVRRRRESVRSGSHAPVVGFHTNVATKSMIITSLIARVRECGYVERDSGACNEMAVYEQDASGRYGAKKGYHDDVLMTRAIALYVISTMPVAELPPV